MIRDISRRHSDRLLTARQDSPGTRFFITFCTHARRKLLNDPGVAEPLLGELKRLREEDAVYESSVMVMPDHVHWLFRQGASRTLGQLVGRVKSLTSPVLRKHAAAWLRNYFEHRLRPEDFMEDFALYMFLNPYRAGLIPPDRPWSHWSRPGDLRFEFEEHLTPQGTPPPDWITTTQRPFAIP